MKLTKIHVTNFRSAEDSGEFDVNQVLCLVGKNEAGKTAILQALAGLNPHPSAPVVYDIERDYPRRWLTEYKARHGADEATVIQTKWELSKEEKQTLKEVVGDALLERPVLISRRYNDKEPRLDPPIDIAKAVRNLIASEKLTEEDCQPLSATKNSIDLRKALEGINEPSQKQQRLLEKLNELPDKTIAGFATHTLRANLPQFLYSSHYDRMVGEIRLDNFNARKQKQVQPPLEPGERIFIDFLEYAGTSVDEINSATTYESLNARCEAASNAITQQLQEFWGQNPYLEIEVRVTKAEQNDQPPFNQGIVARARVKNNLHKLTLPFSERSAGFIWFFSFLVQFAQVRKTGGNLILLLDEPGLSLHGKAQEDLLRYIDVRLKPNHQVIYSTHSPFMVPADDLPSVRIAEDKIVQLKPGQWTSDGTKVRDDTLATDRDTLFPLQGALGYEMTQTLFVGKHTLLVEGPGDILYLYAWSSALQRRGKPGLDRRWTVCPAGGIDKIQPFVALFSGQKLDIAALTDYAKADRKKLETLRQNKILESNRLLTFATILGVDEADIEDVFNPALYAEILNKAFELPAGQQATATTLVDADHTTIRLLKKATAYFAVLPPQAPEFNHYTPADWLARNPAALDADTPEVNETLDRAEKTISALNALLPMYAAAAH